MDHEAIEALDEELAKQRALFRSQPQDSDDSQNTASVPHVC